MMSLVQIMGAANITDGPPRSSAHCGAGRPNTFTKCYKFTKCYRLRL